MDTGPIGLGATGGIVIIYMEDFQLRTIEMSPYPVECQIGVDWGNREIMA